MGYARYTVVRNGRAILAGYAVPDRCNRRWCRARIDRGLDYLCGRSPGDQHGCGGYFCYGHLHPGPAEDVPQLCADCAAAYRRQRLAAVADMLAAVLAAHTGTRSADVMADRPDTVLIEAGDGFEYDATLHAAVTRQVGGPFTRARQVFTRLARPGG